MLYIHEYYVYPHPVTTNEGVDDSQQYLPTKQLIYVFALSALPVSF